MNYTHHSGETQGHYIDTHRSRIEKMDYNGLIGVERERAADIDTVGTEAVSE
jgi:hypothetical protein